MSSIIKILRHCYWLAESFTKKNLRLIILSFVISFFLFFLLASFFPFISSFFLRKKEKIGMVGNYNLNSVPDEITNLISNPLVSVNEKGELVAVLVNSWQVSDQHKTYRFFLKSDLFWSDNKRLTASDIELDFEGIEREVIDQSTIEFKLSQPLSTFPVYLSKPLIKYPLKGVAGLYRIQGYKLDKDKLVSLHLYPNKEDLPYKIYQFYDSEDSLIAAYKKGEINQFVTSKKSLADQFSSWRNTQIKKSVNYNQILTLFFNNQKQLLSSKDVRKGLASATPKFDQLGEEANGPIPPLSWAFYQQTKQYPFNIDKAKSILENNISATQSAELDFYTFFDYINVAETIKQSLEQAGLKINLRVLSYLPQEFDILLTMWNPPVDPDQYYFWHSTQSEDNITNYKNVKVDKLLEDGRRTIILKERKEIYQEFQETIMEDVPAVFIYHPFVYTIERK